MAGHWAEWMAVLSVDRWGLWASNWVAHSAVNRAAPKVSQMAVHSEGSKAVQLVGRWVVHLAANWIDLTAQLTAARMVCQSADYWVSQAAC